MSLQICAPASVIRNEKHEKPNNSNNTCPYRTAKVRHLPQQIQSLSAQPPLPNVKHALVGVIGGFQPDKLASAFAGEEDGMYARFLYSWPAPPAASNTVVINARCSLRVEADQ